MNLCTFVGRLTKDPEIRYSEGEQQMAIAKFVLAVDRNYKAAKEEESADFFPCVAFDKRAEFAEKYLYKGMRVALCGKMRNNNYTNKDGEKVYGNSLYVDNIEFADGKRDGGEEPLPQPEEQNTGAARSNSQSARRGTTQTAGQRTGTRGGQPAGTSARSGTAQSGGQVARSGTAQSAGQTARAGASQASGQTAGIRSTGTARQGTAANRTAARGTAAGSGTAGRSAAARGTGARAASPYGDGFMNIPDGIEDEGLPFH